MTAFPPDLCAYWVADIVWHVSYEI